MRRKRSNWNAREGDNHANVYPKGRLKRSCNVCGLSPCDCDRRRFTDDGDEPPPERIDRETARRELGLDL